MNEPLKGLTRRTFLRYLSRIAAALGFQPLVSACSDSSTEPEPEPEPVEAKISGPTIARLGDGGEVTGTYRSQSTPRERIERQDWGIRRISEPAQQAYTPFGEGSEASYTFTVPNERWQVQLRVTPTLGDVAEALHETQVLPPAEPPPTYVVPIAFFRFSGLDPALCFMPPTSPQNTTAVLEDSRLSTTRVSWEPNGDRLVLELRDVGAKSNLYTFDPQTQELTPLVSKPGILWQPAWSPKGDWIAYVDDTRPGGLNDELVLIRPDGTEMTYLSGSATDEAFYGFYPSWDPDGQRIALGSTRWLEGSRPVSRLAIYSDLWSANPTRQRLHTEAQLLEGYGSSADLDSLDEGGNGVAWSPNGEIMACCSVWWDNAIQDVRQRVVLANADGSGIIRVLDRPKAGSSLTWSPDGQYLYFAAHVGPQAQLHIYRVNADGGNEVDMSALTGAQDPNDYSPAWYG